MPDAEFVASIIADNVDSVIDQIEMVQDAGKAVDEMDPTVTLTAENMAGDEIADLMSALGNYADSDFKAAIGIESDTAALSDANDMLAQFDSSDHATTVSIEADTAAVDDVNAALSAIPEEKTSAVNVDASGATQSVNEFSGTLNQVTDLMGKMGITGSAGLSKITKAAVGTTAAVGLAGAAAKRSVDQFVTLATTQDKSAKAAGMAVEEYSRWAAALDRMGVSGAQFNVALMGLNKGIDGGAKALDKYGIAAKNADGSIRSHNDILLDTIGTLSTIESAELQASAAKEIFGRAYKQLAPVIGKTEEEMRGYLDAVNESIVISEKEAAKAMEMKIAQESLQQSLLGVKLELGEMLVAIAPLITAISKLVGVLGDSVGTLVDFASGIGDVASSALDAIPGLDALGEAGSGMFEKGGDLKDAFWGGPGAFADFMTGTNTAAEGLDELNTAHLETANAMMESGKTAGETAEALTQLGVAENDVQQIMEAAGVGEEELSKARMEHAATVRLAKEEEQLMTAVLQEEIGVVTELAGAQQERADAMRAAVDSTFALTDAQVAHNEAIAGYGAAIAATNGDALKMQQVNNEMALSAAGVADAFVKVAQDAAIADGAMLGVTDAADMWTSQMLAQAEASGAAGGAIVDYVTAIHKIPAEASTEIRTLFEEGNIAEAERRIAELSVNRAVRLDIDANTDTAEAAHAELAALAEDPLTVPYWADNVPANAQIAETRAAAEAPVDIPLTTDTEPVKAEIAAVAAEPHVTTMQVNGNAVPVDDVISAVESGDYETLINLNADDTLALAIILALISKKREAPIDAVVHGDAEAREELNDVAQPRRAPIDAYLRDYPTANDIAGRIGVVRVPVDAYERSAPRVTGTRD